MLQFTSLSLADETSLIKYSVTSHRVLRTDGSLGGYRWGIDRKIAWLKREGAPYLF